MTSKLKFVIALASASILGNYNSNAAEAQNPTQPRSTPMKIEGDGGGLFMEEEQTQSSRGRDLSQPKVNVINENAPKQQVNDNAGNGFMEEVTQPTPIKKPRVPIDLRNTNVQVDRRGHIVPMINRTDGPVQSDYNSGIQAYREMPIPTYAPTYGNPMALPYDAYGRPAANGTAFVPVAPGTIPGIRSMNLPPGYYYGNNYGYSPYSQTQYSGTYSQTSLTGDSAGMIMPMFRNSNR